MKNHIAKTNVYVDPSDLKDNHTHSIIKMVPHFESSLQAHIDEMHNLKKNLTLKILWVNLIFIVSRVKLY